MSAYEQVRGPTALAFAARALMGRPLTRCARRAVWSSPVRHGPAGRHGKRIRQGPGVAHRGTRKHACVGVVVHVRQRITAVEPAMLGHVRRTREPRGSRVARAGTGRSARQKVPRVAALARGPTEARHGTSMPSCLTLGASSSIHRLCRCAVAVVACMARELATPS